MHAALSSAHPFADFKVFYESHLGLVQSIVRRFRFHDAAADDLVQDIFVKAWSSVSQLENPQCLTGWVRVIARNHCLNELKARKSSEALLVDVDTVPEKDLEWDPFQHLQITQEERLQVLHSMIRSHGDETRRTIACMFYREHRTIKDIAADLAMNPNTVLSHLRRFRLIVTRAMRRWMEEQLSNV